MFKAASILKISSLKHWIGKSWSSGQLNDCFNAIKECATSILFKPIINIDNNIDTRNGLRSPNSAASDGNMFFSNYNNDDQENFESNSEIQLENFEHQIFLEVEKYRRIISEDNFKLVKQVSSTKNFWLKSNLEFPYLSKLVLVLANICSSSAFIERYFSICGFIQNKRSSNITVELFIKRCFLRANVKILNELKM